MLQTGNKITQIDDPLSKVDLDYVYRMVKSPKPEVLYCISQLRIVRSIDKQRYSQQKKLLPYFVSGIFNPPVRRTEHFCWIDTLILDIDHVSQYEKDIENLRSTFINDSRVALCFVSPGEDGLKLFFKLSEKCYDAGKFSLFYKCFASSIAKQYQIEEMVDTRTSDVTRACFCSYDPQVFYNPDAKPLNMEAILNFDDMYAISQIKNEFKKIEKEKTTNETAAETSKDPDDETMRLIRSRLNPKLKAREEKHYFVPEILNDIVKELQFFLENIGFVVIDIKSIQYGKKISLQLGNKRAEINLFFGKRGFSVVQTSKSGTSSDLNQLGADCIKQFLLENAYF